MKKYNLSNIMKRAWSLVNGLEMTLSEALKKAWAEAKALVEKITFEKFAKVLIPNRIDYWESESNYLTFKLWKKGGYSRIYINDYKGRTCGYIDAKTKELHLDGNRDVAATAESFIKLYIF